jgi:hypothetical protein
MKNANDFLQEKFGVKDSYSRFETVIAMIDYAAYVLAYQRDLTAKAFESCK